MKILYFYPENPLLLSQGNNSRAFSMLNFFKSKNIKVDFIGEESIFFKEEDIDKLIEKKLITNGLLLSEYNRSKNPISYFFYTSLPEKIGIKIKDLDRLRYKQISKFNKILKSNDYNYIVISYVYWANLVINNPNIDRSKTKIIIDTHDFLTSQFSKNKNFEIGNYFKKEIATLQYFDYIIAISIEEKYLFSQFIEERKVILVSHGLKENFKSTKLDYEIVYVASDNEHNIKGANWFFNYVFPLLPKEINICIVGKINSAINIKFENIKKIVYLHDLDEVYRASKIAICPMFSGTGIKIKVLEALSYGIPVVCTNKGVDGLINKRNNGCFVTNEADIFAKHIIKLLSDKKYYEISSQTAKDFFCSYYEESNCYNELSNILI